MQSYTEKQFRVNQQKKKSNRFNSPDGLLSSIEHSESESDNAETRNKLNESTVCIDINNQGTPSPAQKNETK